MNESEWKSESQNGDLQGEEDTVYSTPSKDTPDPSSSNARETGRVAVPMPAEDYSSADERPPPSDNLSDASQDSFDWIGDDRRDEESEYEEAFVDEISAPGTTPPAPNNVNVRYKNFLNSVLLVIMAMCVILWLCSLTSIGVPVIAQVPFHLWVTLVFLSVFVPVWSQTAIRKIVRLVKSTSTLSRSDLPSKIENIAASLSVCIGAVVIGLYWKAYFPDDCVHLLTQENLFEFLEADKALGYLGYCGFSYVPRILVFIFICGLTSAAGSFVMISLRSNFQEKTFKSRLIENRFKIHVVDMLLLAAKRQRIARRYTIDNTAARHNAVNIGQTTRDFMFNLPFVIPEQIVAWWRRDRRTSSYNRIVNGLALEDYATVEFSEFRDEIIRTIQVSGYETIATAPPRTDHEAKIMARMIFHYLCAPNTKILSLEDFSAIIINDAASKDAFDVFDYDKDGAITKNEFRGAIVRIFREQRNLAQSVANTGSVLSILDTIGMCAMTAGLFLFLLALFGVRVVNLIGFTASIVLTLNFLIFEATNKMFHSLIFLFVIHPYDVGDRVVMGREVGSSDEDVLTVTNINIQNTVFKRWNGLFVIVPNHVLAANPLTNLSRGSEQWERVEFTLCTPDKNKLTMEEETSRLASLRKRIETFLHHYSQDYYQSFELRAVIAADNGQSDRNLDSLKLCLKVRCKQTADSQKKWVRHSRILAFLKQAVNRSGIEFAS
ncbi:EF-Hand 1, calcium-binding site domain-containing protein [Paramicrosporidium saccamoebae]|uniref:EF-Hand 1, calcium-binding site domain-containing protein n=1 Tax=Paramicrosporidium saccamoebae TaxID=1246581 RepID=A0A2H9TPZ8_9FUNG|nr:EF-Hand 1, calcium-binding site domain-containing protein [Paramicrosporidium saccamoebae]